MHSSEQKNDIHSLFPDREAAEGVKYHLVFKDEDCDGNDLTIGPLYLVINGSKKIRSTRYVTITEAKQIARVLRSDLTVF